jgi:hypothetical protein
MRSDRANKDDLIDAVMGRMTLCWKPFPASFSTALHDERQPNGVAGESGEERAELPPLAAE